MRSEILTGSGAMHFIHQSAKHLDWKATYCRVVAEINIDKKVIYCVRLTVRGNKMRTAELKTVKLHLNSVVNDVNASFFTTDKYFYLNMSIYGYGYMHIPTKHLPRELVEQYQLEPLMINGYVVVEIRKGIFDFP